MSEYLWYHCFLEAKEKTYPCGNGWLDCRTSTSWNTVWPIKKKKKKWSIVLADDLEGFPGFDFLHDGFPTFINASIEKTYKDQNTFWIPLGFKQIGVLLIPILSIYVWYMIAHVFVRYTIYLVYMQCSVWGSIKNWLCCPYRVSCPYIWDEWTGPQKEYIILHKLLSGR